MSTGSKNNTFVILVIFCDPLSLLADNAFQLQSFGSMGNKNKTDRRSPGFSAMAELTAAHVVKTTLVANTFLL